MKIRKGITLMKLQEDNFFRIKKLENELRKGQNNLSLNNIMILLKFNFIKDQHQIKYKIEGLQVKSKMFQMNFLEEEVFSLS
jgi:hypothetical protein